jgi:Amt family ammonium transporter
MGYQLAGICSIVGWTTVMTISLCYIINYIPGLKMRVSEGAEEIGLDLYEMAECAYPLSAMGYGDDYFEYFNGQSRSSAQVSKKNFEIQEDMKVPVEVV